ncbi:TRAP transporter small permease subunit [Halomonas elongata]|uniref:TRAP transporter small permease subunit n=1 Tax=Halomonas elongata TaxID=2746 RepID=UPI0038D468E1
MTRTFETVYWLYSKVVLAAALIAGAATFAIMWLIALSALLRTLFNAPIPASVEISQALLVLCITFPLGFTLMKREHVRTIVLAQRLPVRAQHLIYALWMMIGTLVFAAATYGTFQYGMRSYNMNEMVWGATIQFPLWPSKLAVSIGCGMLTIQFALEALGAMLIPGFVPIEKGLDAEAEASHV